LGCGANFAKQFVANNTRHKLAAVNLSIVNIAVVNFTVNIAVVNFTVVHLTVVHLTNPVDDSRHQLKHDPDHHDANHADLKR
jgi:hypothetical protein